MRLFASILAIAALAAGPAFAADASKAGAPKPKIAGKWSGQMTHLNTSAKYPMMLTLDGKTGMTSYPTLKCGGELKRVGKAKGGYRIYRETIKNQPGANCIDGLITVHVEGDKVVLGWFISDAGVPSVASAVLKKDAK